MEFFLTWFQFCSIFSFLWKWRILWLLAFLVYLMYSNLVSDTVVTMSHALQSRMIFCCLANWLPVQLIIYLTSETPPHFPPPSPPWIISVFLRHSDFKICGLLTPRIPIILAEEFWEWKSTQLKISDIAKHCSMALHTLSSLHATYFYLTCSKIWVIRDLHI